MTRCTQLATALVAALTAGLMPLADAASPSTPNPAVINVNMTTTIPIPAKFSGFNAPQLRNGVEYYDPKFVAAVMPLNPGMLRFPAGTAAMAYDWNAGHMNQTWINNLINGPPPMIGAPTATNLQTAQIFTQAKGGSYLSDFATFANTFGSPAIICFNSYTDFNTNSAMAEALAAQADGVNVLDWELSNEAYLYNVIYPTAASYASAGNPFFNNIISASPAANVSLFSSGLFPGTGLTYPNWDPGLAAYSPRYWNAASVHIYPVASQQTAKITANYLNGVLGYGSSAFINSYLLPLVGANTPIYISEFNCCSSPDGNPFISYLYNGIFLAEYIMRMSAVPNVKAIGVNSLFTNTYDYHGIIQSVNDYAPYLAAQVAANPNYSTNTATDPNTQYQFYVSAPGVALEVANQAINNSTSIWPTTVTGGRTVAVQGFTGQPIPAVYAQGYLGNTGSHYLLITNKGAASQGVTIEVNGVALTGTLSLTYVSNTNPEAANSATAQTNVQVQTSTVSTNPFLVGPYSVTLVTW